jgi:hypothetical protein
MARVLARCNGYDVAAGDEIVGSVETPVFSGTKLEPDYLIVRLGDSLHVVPPELIVSVDSTSHTLFLGLDTAELAQL